MSDLNLSNSIFQGYNDKHGLMICGYEWGWSKADEAANVGTPLRRKWIGRCI